MAIEAIKKPNISFEDWIKAEGKENQVKKPPQTHTENGVLASDAQRLLKGESVFDVATNTTPTKETATAGGASSSGIGSLSSGMNMNDSIFSVPTGNDTSVQGASATGHTHQVQSPLLVSGLKASQGGDNAGSQGGATSYSKTLNQNLYAQYEFAMKEARIANQSGDVSTGEGTISTGGTDGPSGSGDVNGPDGTNGVNNGGSAPPTGDVGETDPTNSPPDNSGNNENPNDSSNDSSANINRQEQHRQEQILDSRRFRKLGEEAA